MDTNTFRLPSGVLVNIVPIYLEDFITATSTKKTDDQKINSCLSRHFYFIANSFINIGAAEKIEHLFIPVYYHVCFYVHTNLSFVDSCYCNILRLKFLLTMFIFCRYTYYITYF